MTNERCNLSDGGLAFEEAVNRVGRNLMLAHVRIIGRLAMGCVAMVLLNVGLTDISVAGPIEDAATAYKNRDFPTALKLWQPLAEEGNPAAESGLGILYENGFAVEKDPAQAVVWFRKAAEQNDAEAEYRLGERYVQGSGGLPHDVAQGLSLMMKAADQGHVISQTSIGDLYRHGFFGVPKDATQAFVWYKKAAELGYALAETRVGIAYETGDGVERDLSQSNLWYQRAMEQRIKDAEAGSISAQLSVGQGYETGVMGYPKDKATALLWYRKAVQQNGPLKEMAEKDVARLETELKQPN